MNNSKKDENIFYIKNGEIRIRLNENISIQGSEGGSEYHYFYNCHITNDLTGDNIFLMERDWKDLIKKIIATVEIKYEVSKEDISCVQKKMRKILLKESKKYDSHRQGN
jgi:hypothetical protein